MSDGFCAARRSRLLVSVCFATLVVGTAVPVLAQDQVASVSDSGLADIIVTAQRRSERLEDVPVSVTALSADDLAKANVVSFRDIETVAAGTRIASTGIFVQPAIRGITATAVGAGIENNVAFYVDGFYQPNNAALGADLANVSSVQVLKGPQGTLYGRNALGGAILVSTREPTDKEAAVFDGEATYGSRDDIRLRAYLGARITEGVSVGAGVYHRQNDGYIRLVDGASTQPVVNLNLTAFGGPNIPNYITPSTSPRNAGAFENTELRLKLKVEPSPYLSIVLGYNYLYKFNPGPIAYNNSAYSYLSGLPVPAAGTPAHAVGRDEYSGNLPIDFNVRQNEGTLKVSLDTSVGTLNSYTNYMTVKPNFDQDFDGTLVNFLRIKAGFREKTFAESLDFTSELTSALTATVGGLYYHDVSRSLPTQITALGNFSTTPGLELDTRAYALFGDLTWQPIERLFINAGLRYSNERKRLDTVRIPGGKAQVTFSDLTPKFSIRYEFAPRSNVYASFSQGFKSGTFNTVGQTPAQLTTPVDPESVDAYEIGIKMARSSFRFEAAAYYYKYSNLQVSSLITEPSTGRVGTFLSNAASAENYGAEASVTVTPVESLNLRASVAYTHARYTDFPDASARLVCVPAAGGVPRNQETYIVGCPFTGAQPAVGTPLSQDMSGRRIARAPDWTASISGDYTVPIGGGSLVLAGNLSVSSAYEPTTEIYDPLTGRPRHSEDGYVMGSVSLTYNAPGDHWWARGFIDNVGNTRFKIVSTGSTRGDYDIYSEPRRFGVTLGYRY